MNDDELRQALTVLDTYKMQLDALGGQAQILQMSLEETLRARDTLAAMDKAKEGDEVLIPIGSSSFVPAKVTGNRNAVVGIGNRISVEKDFKDAFEYMSANAEEINAALKKATEAIREINNAANELSVAVQQEYQRRQQ